MSIVMRSLIIRVIVCMIMSAGLSSCVQPKEGEDTFKVYRLHTLETYNESRFQNDKLKMGEVTRVVLPTQTVGRCGGSEGLNCSVPWFANIIIHGAGFGRSASTQFRGACNTHDYCYRHAASLGTNSGSEYSQRTCDERLEQDTKDLCKLINREGYLWLCELRASVVEKGVKYFGEKYFRPKTGVSASTYCNYDSDSEFFGDVWNTIHAEDPFGGNEDRHPYLFDVTFGESEASVRLGVGLISVPEGKTDRLCRTSGIKLVSYSKDSKEKVEHNFWCGMGNMVNEVGYSPHVNASMFHSRSKDVLLLSYVSDGTRPMVTPPTVLHYCDSYPSGLVLRTFTIEKSSPDEIVEKSWLLKVDSETYKLGQYPPIITDYDGDHIEDIVLMYRRKGDEGKLSFVFLDGGELQRDNRDTLEPDQVVNHPVSDIYHPFHAVAKVESVHDFMMTSIAKNDDGVLSLLRIYPLLSGVESVTESKCKSKSCSVEDETLLPVIDIEVKGGEARMILPSRTKNEELKFRIYNVGNKSLDIGHPEAVLLCSGVGSMARVCHHKVENGGVKMEVCNGSYSFGVFYKEGDMNTTNGGMCRRIGA